MAYEKRFIEGCERYFREYLFEHCINTEASLVSSIANTVCTDVYRSWERREYAKLIYEQGPYGVKGLFQNQLQSLYYDTHKKMGFQKALADRAISESLSSPKGGQNHCRQFGEQSQSVRYAYVYNARWGLVKVLPFSALNDPLLRSAFLLQQNISRLPVSIADADLLQYVGRSAESSISSYVSVPSTSIPLIPCFGFGNPAALFMGAIAEFSALLSGAAAVAPQLQYQ